MTVDSWGIPHPVTSVEMLVDNKWNLLPRLPTIKHRWIMSDWIMSLPTAINWFPAHGVYLVGGCVVDYSSLSDYCTADIWKLMYDTDQWYKIPDMLGKLT